jgi:hypothetical protein
MNAHELAEKFRIKVAVAVVEKDKQAANAADHATTRSDDAEYCKRALEENVIPFLSELKQQFPSGQFSFAPQVDMRDHKPVGVCFKIGDGAPINISTAFGNIIVTRSGDSGSSKGIGFVYPPDVEPYISNSGDLTRDKLAKLVAMVIDNNAG